MSVHFVSIIGSGNVARHLAPALDNAGFIVKEVYSRNPQHAEALTEHLYQAEVKATLDFSTSDSTIFIIAVSDDAIQDVAREIILPDDAILVHTSGSQSLNILQYAASIHVGILYPLQTFTASRKLDFKTIPVFVESDDEETGRILLHLAKAISSSVRQIRADERRALHVAAVFASNFINHLLNISGEILQENELEFELLNPLITETISKSLKLGPRDAQTGPARRGDLSILDNHLEFLKNNPPVAEIYKVISQHIVDQYGG